jgi:hypothetical protein
LQVDFSENYTCVSQDEIQSAHWNQNQVSLFTVALWHSGNLNSQVFASDHLVHAKETVIAYMETVIDKLPTCVKQLSVWSDGPASQFKNKYIAAAILILEKKHNIKIYWNYFATSHGKGAVDGIGGAVKRYVWQKVKSRRAQVSDSKTFVDAAKDMANVHVRELTYEQITGINQQLSLDTLFENAKPIPSVSNVHHFRIIDQGCRRSIW